MKYTLTREKDTAKVAFELTAQEWDDAQRQAYEKTKDKYSMPGFRKGKVPMNRLKAAYGDGVFFDEAFNIAFPKYYSEMLDAEAELFPVDRPDVSFDDIDDKGIKFSATITLKPTITLGEYKGRVFVKASYDVSEDEIKHEIDHALERASRRIEITDRAVCDGDLVDLNYSGAVDGKKFDGGTAENQELKVGSKTFIPGFEEQLIGLNIGEEKAVNVTFPTEYHAKELAGANAVFMVKINKIFKVEIPELNDEFVKDTSKFDTVADYTADVKARLTEAAKKREETEDENTMLKAITESSSADIPRCMLETQLDHLMQDFEYRLMYQGMKLDDYLKYTNMKIDDIRKQQEPQALQAVLTRLVIEEIIKKENIQVTDEDKAAKIEAMAKMAGKTAKDLEKTLDQRRLDYMENEIIMDKVLALLKSANKWTSGKKEPQKPKKSPVKKAEEKQPETPES